MTWQKFVNNAKRTTTGRRIPFRALLLLYYPLRSRIAQRLKLERVPYLPYRLDVDHIDICNFACDHCQVTPLDSGASRNDGRSSIAMT